MDSSILGPILELPYFWDPDRLQVQPLIALQAQAVLRLCQQRKHDEINEFSSKLALALKANLCF